ncbi:MAG: hypothetical protein K2K64_00905 [Muribaculaceae bacterium]|nr:hypothetical protein [Muribaculaceae bacterium]
MIKPNQISDPESVNIVEGTPELGRGSAGLSTQLPGHAATVSAIAEATGGISDANMIGTAIDDELFRFNNEDTPLMNLMLRAKRVNVNSPEVDHYMIDEPRSFVEVAETVGGSTRSRFTLPLTNDDANSVRPYCTLLVQGVNGYDPTGAYETPGKDLLLFVTGIDPGSGSPVVRPVNGRKNSPEEEYGYLPEIKAGTRLVILANSLYETQKEVDPDLILPQPTRIYLQKRGMNQVVSDYFESQKKRIPFSQAVIAEQAIANFKVRGNRTLWASRAGKFKTSVDKMGMQTVYTTEGLRWQFKRELQEPGKWSVEKIIALAKMFFTGEDVPKSAILLAGKNLLEKIQTIDYSGHPEIQITSKVNSVGWVVTNFHTVFGDIEIKREPTLDRLGWSNSGALIGDNRLVHYVYSSEHTFEDRVEGEEATRNGILIWDAVALKGSCHIWIDGDSREPSTESGRIVLWDKSTLPAKSETLEGAAYYFTESIPETGIKGGSMYRAEADGTSGDFKWIPVKEIDN